MNQALCRKIMVLASLACLSMGCGSGGGDEEERGRGGSEGESNAGGDAGGTSTGGSAGGANRGGIGGTLSAGGNLGSGGSTNVGGIGGNGGEGGGAGMTPTGRPFVYVSGYANKITVLRLDLVTGQLTKQSELAVPSGSASYLAFAPSRKFLFGAIEDGTGAAQSFTINPETGAVTNNGSRPGGDTATHIGIEGAGRYVATASYTEGTVSVFSIAANGTLARASGPIASGMRSHQAVFAPGDNFVVVPASAAETISSFRVSATGMLSRTAAGAVKLAADTGPRHLAFHPNGKFFYAIHEKAQAVQAFSFDATTGAIASVQDRVSLRAPGTSDRGSGSEVQVSPDGRFVYGSNQLYDKPISTIVRYAVDGITGKLTYLGETPSGGSGPRHFSIDESGQFMLVANSGGVGHVAVLRVDAATGALTPASVLAGFSKVSWAGLVYL
jgi:6-phosphogluconolactonase